HAYLPCGCRPNLLCTALAVRPPEVKSAIQMSMTSAPSGPVDCSTWVPGGALWTLTTTLAPTLFDGRDGNGITLGGSACTRSITASSVRSSFALVSAVVTRSPFFRYHVPSSGTDMIPSCAWP